MSAKVLVTGATGFLGGRLVRALCDAGERVRVLVRPGSSLRSLDGLDVERAEGDVRIEHTVFRALAGCDRLYHCAAVYALWASNPETITEGAVLGTEATLRAARARRIDRVVYTSTAYTIGSSPDPTPLDETTPWVEPAGPVYAIAKRRAEELALDFGRKSGLPIVVVNPCSIFGPGDFRPTPTGQSVLEVMRGPSVPGLGVLVPKPPGGFNVVDVDDVVFGHRRAMERGRPGERYILGSENMPLATLFTTIADLAGRPPPRLRVGRPLALATGALLSAVAHITGETPTVSYDTVRGSFGLFYYTSSAKAADELGYVAKPARVALARSVRFFVDHGFLSEAQARRIRLDATAMAAA
jgi:dihydroflavonol-4-reductase